VNESVLKNLSDAARALDCLIFEADPEAPREAGGEGIPL